MCKRAVLPSEAKAGERRAVLVLDDVDSYTCVCVTVLFGVAGEAALAFAKLCRAQPARWAEVAKTRGGKMLSHAHTHTHKKSTLSHPATHTRSVDSLCTKKPRYKHTAYVHNEWHTHATRSGVLSRSARVWLQQHGAHGLALS
jgi:hypothetical protein